jgi:hypothetical protein
MYIALQVECLLFLSDFNEILNFLLRFVKDIQILNFTKIRLVGATLFHQDGKTEEWADGQTDMTKLVVAFGDFVKGKNGNPCKSRICLPTVYMQYTEIIKSMY